MINPAQKKYFELFGVLPDFVVKSPGRINLIGEHTDYNGGLVMPAAIDMFMYMAIGHGEMNQVCVHSMLLDTTQKFELKNITNTNDGWIEYFKGLIKTFINNGMNITGLNCVIYSDIPLGAGVSSSSALECAFITGIDEMFNCNLDAWDMITISQESNHNYLGVQGGILDQFAIFFGREGNAIKLNCSTREFEYLPANIDAHSWVLINTNVKHNHTESGYNDRVAECKLALTKIKGHLPKIDSLSDLSGTQVEKLKSSLDHISYIRTKFVVEENARVAAFKESLKIMDVDRIRDLLLKSHEGLRSLYEVSCAELDFVVSFLKQSAHVSGARMMGGGFGGCVITLMKTDHVDRICQQCQVLYAQAFNKHADYFQVRSTDRCQVMK